MEGCQRHRGSGGVGSSCQTGLLSQIYSVHYRTYGSIASHYYDNVLPNIVSQGQGKYIHFQFEESFMMHCKPILSPLQFSKAVITLSLSLISFTAAAVSSTSNFLNAPAGGATDFHIIFSQQFEPGGGVFSSTPFGEPYNLYLKGNSLDYQSVEIQPAGTPFSMQGWSFRLHGNVPFPAGSMEVVSYYWTLLGEPVIGSGGGPYPPGTAALVPVPEPETYAMLLAGLGLMGSIARRRSNKQA